MKKLGIQLLSLIAPNKVLKLAYNNLTSPQIKKLRPHEIEVLEQARKEDYAFNDFTIKTYAWGKGSKKILLVHGWEGQAGNFSELIPKLLEADYKVYAFDGPSHGFSSVGKTSLFEFTTLVGDLIAKWKVNQLISHSFGGVATTFALSQKPDLQIEKYVLFTTPDRFEERIASVCESVGISNTIKMRLIKQLEEETGIKVNEMNVSDFAPKTNVNKALVLHDVNDKVIPIEQSKRVVGNWPVAVMEEVSNTGHFRILRTERVLGSAMDFLSDAP